ncbi:MAG TPA: dihydrolipoyl dehydrogenase [Gemmataceae bacterium]|jgi:dihydrolipoamide dehydrogenase|nr:dihydrolipoyl dehydrogenase [Gemmataceae bacterium]
MSEVSKETQLLIIGGGPGGYPAAIHAADHGLKPILVDEGPKLGGVCTNRGCIPSKALLHLAKLVEEAKEAAEWGVSFGTPKIDLAKMQAFVQQKVVGKLTGGIGMLCKGRGVEVITGSRASFIDANTVKLEGATTGTIKFQNAVIATGSVPAMPKAFALGDPRIMDSTGALLMPDIPKRMLVIGGGYIGLEIGTVYAALGTKIVIVEFTDGLLPTADRDLVKPLETRLKARFEAIHLNTKVASLQPTDKGIIATLEGKDVPAQEIFDRVLVSVGRRPNSAGMSLDKAGVNVSERGYIPVDRQRRTSVPHIFALGDVAEEPGLAHKATAEAKVAVETILGEPSAFEPRAIPAVVFTDPELAWAGLTERDAAEKNIRFEKMMFPWAASGRATTLARNDGLTKLLVDPATQRILGVGIVGVGAGEMIAEGVLAIEMGAVARDIADSIHPHPTLSETIMESAELALGGATHIAKPKKVQR